MSSGVSDPDFLKGLGLGDYSNGSDQYPKNTPGDEALKIAGIDDTTHLYDLNAPLVRVDRQEEARKKQEEARKKQEEEEAYAALMENLRKRPVKSSSRPYKPKKGGSRRRTRSRGNKRKSRRTRKRTRRSKRSRK